MVPAEGVLRRSRVWWGWAVETALPGRTSTAVSSGQRGNEVSQACYLSSKSLDFRGVGVIGTGVRDRCNGGRGSPCQQVCRGHPQRQDHPDVRRETLKKQFSEEGIGVG